MRLHEVPADARQISKYGKGASAYVFRVTLKKRTVDWISDLHIRHESVSSLLGDDRQIDGQADRQTRQTGRYTDRNRAYRQICRTWTACRRREMVSVSTTS